MSLLEDALNKIKPLDQEVMDKTWEHLDSLSKPLRSLGVLEEIAVKISGMTGEVFNKIKKKNILIFCADNGVCDEGVSGCSQEVTNIVTNNLPNYTTGVGILAKFYGSEIRVIDVGVKGIISNKKVIDRKIREGSNNMALGEALTREEVIKAINIGIESVDILVKEGYNLIGTGEMGIGNTSTSTAVIAALLDLEVEELVGLGAGLTEGGLENKKKILRRSLELNNPNKEDVIDVLSKVGGLDIASLCGSFIGAAKNRIPIVIDGLISSAAALCAYKIDKGVKNFMFSSHKSTEKAMNEVYKEMNLEPMFDLKMRLGEGSGCPIAFSIIESALTILSEMDTFDKAGLDNDESENYKKLYEERKKYEKEV